MPVAAAGAIGASRPASIVTANPAAVTDSDDLDAKIAAELDGDDDDDAVLLELRGGASGEGLTTDEDFEKVLGEEDDDE